MRQRPTAQVYENYTTEDFEVWEILFNRQMQGLFGTASQLYLEAVKDIGFTDKVIPDFEKMSKLLLSKTGWRVQVAPCLVPEVEFFNLLANRIFPATCWLRSLKELDYLEEPDMFHDVFGHVPLLINPEYAAFMQRFGAAALPWLDNPFAISLFSRVYWYTIEFGLLIETDQPKIFGAGIISSITETQNVIKNRSKERKFDLETVLNTPYRTDDIQEVYFAINSFEMLNEIIPEVSKQLKAMLVEN